MSVGKFSSVLRAVTSGRKFYKMSEKKVVPYFRGQSGGQLPKSAAGKKRIEGLFKDLYTPAQIVKLTGLGRSYVYRVCEDLAKKENRGHLGDKKGETRPLCPLPPNSDKSNVHAMKVRAFVHWMSPKYKASPNQFWSDVVHGVEVQSSGRLLYLSAKGEKFFGGDEEKALWNALGFWKAVLRKVEEKLGVVVLKPKAHNFEFVYWEWETQGSVVARDAAERDTIWRVYHSEDGKLRLDVDWSLPRGSHETHHKRDALSDSETFNRQINDMLDNPQAPTLPELAAMVRSLVVVVGEQGNNLRDVTIGLAAVVDVLRPQVFKNEDFKGRVDYVG